MTKAQAMQTAHAYVANVLYTVVNDADDPYPLCEDGCRECRVCRDSIRLEDAIDKILTRHTALAVDHRRAEEA